MRGAIGQALMVTALVFTSLGALTQPVSSSATTADGITWTVSPQMVEIQTPNATILISTEFPAAMVKHIDDQGVHGDGFLFSSVLGYNATLDGGVVLDEVPYHAPMDEVYWTMEGPASGTDQVGGQIVTATMTGVADIHRRLVIGGGGNPDSGSPGAEVIEGWAVVTVQFSVSEDTRFATYEEIVSSPEYEVNGSSELKFDISIEIQKDIFADRIALDMGLMKMEYGVFGPSITSGPYYFRGYEDGEMTVCDPTVNETDGTELITHTFQPTSVFKQMFSYVESDDNESGFFAWASQALLDRSDAQGSLEEVTTFYRTNGTALRVYVATPLTDSTDLVRHDPSVGLLGGGGYIDYPDDDIGGVVGLSPLSIAVGMAVGLTAVGGVGVYWARRARADSEDPVDLVSLEKNRYYRHKRR